VIEDDLAFLARLQLLHALTVFDDGQHFAIFGTGLAVTFENACAVLTVDWTRALLGYSLPR
jgi:hypothetical protein